MNEYTNGKLKMIDEIITICEKRIEFTNFKQSTTKESSLVKSGAIKAYKEVINRLKNKRKNIESYVQKPDFGGKA